MAANRSAFPALCPVMLFLLCACFTVSNSANPWDRLLGNLANELSSLQTKVDNLTARLDSTENAQTVAFTAYVSANVNGVSGQVIVFNEIIVNAGNAYDTTTGEFTAPRDGLYFFIINVDVSTDHDCITIQRNRSNVLWADRDDTVSTHLTGSGVIDLQAGDKVRATHCANGGYVEEGRESSFTGFLLG